MRTCSTLPGLGVRSAPGQASAAAADGTPPNPSAPTRGSPPPPPVPPTPSVAAAQRQGASASRRVSRGDTTVVASTSARASVSRGGQVWTLLDRHAPPRPGFGAGASGDHPSAGPRQRWGAASGDSGPRREHALDWSPMEPYSASTRPRISRMISSLPPPIGPRRASRAARSMGWAGLDSSRI